MLDLSDLKEITIADDGGSIKCDAGITVADVVRTLSNLKPGQQLGGLSAVLSLLYSNVPIVEAVIDAALDPESRGREYAQLSKAVEALHVVGKDGSITSKLLSDYNEDTDIVVSVILAASTPGLQKPVRKEPTTAKPVTACPAPFYPIRRYPIHHSTLTLTLAHHCHNYTTTATARYSSPGTRGSWTTTSWRAWPRTSRASSPRPRCHDVMQQWASHGDLNVDK